MFASPTTCASPTINPWRRHCSVLGSGVIVTAGRRAPHRLQRFSSVCCVLTWSDAGWVCGTCLPCVGARTASGARLRLRLSRRSVVLSVVTSTRGLGGSGSHAVSWRGRTASPRQGRFRRRPPGGRLARRVGRFLLWIAGWSRRRYLGRDAVD